MKKQFSGLLLSVCIISVALVARAETDARPSRKTVQAEDGLNIVCDVRGKGETALIFLHGWCGDREYWKNQVNTFAPDYLVVAFDQAGHGQSGKDRKNWTVDALA